ncbi:MULTISPECIES: CCA tRNA nucleotidyltransferase [Clostridium]|jgi:tRNA nucleotidyltransferase (CCA-adding enzyme)|uniref:tRNA nucleotidyltransferase/poly(A) polymerase n=1 Tax=Clostridium sartagoforme AAU1 TaxID=1202534 RepID=R9CB67_9CLOT|nr:MULTISPECIES: CCA tRNA nucleotidyltransferase [Clostridium]EOR26513.1 tRNA nucleotidyltransferase/poly(A) polymerase [Clostridium sartagoforme AAU1]KLE16209.1 polynucleotide adenylyltransferase [Clostridium sp. C8]
MNIYIPNEVKFIIDTFYNNGFEAFMVGGCVRDSILNSSPKDYDITTSAKPEDTLSIFEKTIPTGINHGTVTVLINNNSYEVTTYRTDGNYLDNRRPSCVNFVTDIKEDLSRRDFTINALAYNKSFGLIDYFNGINDISKKLIRCVGDADKRFKEDALRMLRAIRFSCQLNFKIEEATLNAIIKNSKLINNISRERIRDELCKILTSNNASEGINTLQKSGLLAEILPEINSLVNFSPLSINHNRNIFDHTLNVISKTNNNLILRLSALLHDVGKLNTLTLQDDGIYRFPNHNVEGAKISKEILRNLRFDNYTINSVSKLIEHHLVLKVNYIPTRYEIKKLLLEVGEDIIYLLFDLQSADIRSLDNPKPFLKKVDYIKDTVSDILKKREPLYIRNLDINGEILLEELNLSSGKIVGEILKYLLEKVLENPSLNKKETLILLSNNFINK